MPAATIKQIKDFFGEKKDGTKFATEWQKLDDKDKADLKNGIGNGSMTY